MLRQIMSPSHQVTKSPVLKKLFLCFLSAILLILSFPRFDIEFLAWFGFVPLFFAIKNKSKWKAFFISYLTGIVFWLGVIYWLIHVTLPGMILLVLYLALYFGIFGLIISTYLLPTTYYLLFIPSIWVLFEYSRSHLFTGFPWALLGYSQYLNLPITQIADITGAWGVSFLVMFVNVFVFGIASHQVTRSPGHQWKKSAVLLACVLFLGTCSYGFIKLRNTHDAIHTTPIKISVIQGNIPQELKWDPESKDFIIDKYLTLTSQAIRDEPDLIVWPEAAMPGVLEKETLYYERSIKFAKEINTPLLIGAVTSRNNLYYNSCLLISKEGQIQLRYDKLHLVPFGEYIPLKKIFGFLETVVPIGDFTPGKEYTVFSLPTTYYLLPTKFSVLICFEDLFPALSREFIKRGANFLVNITNDAWFKQTPSPYQHLQASVFRAVENRVFLVRAANTGISGFISPEGKIISLVQDKSGRNIFISGYDTQEIFISNRKFSFYTKYGDIFILFCLAFVLYCIISKRRRKVTKTP